MSHLANEQWNEIIREWSSKPIIKKYGWKYFQKKAEEKQELELTLLLHSPESHEIPWMF